MSDISLTDPRNWLFKDGDFSPLPEDPLSAKDSEVFDDHLVQIGFCQCVQWNTHPENDWVPPVELWHSDEGLYIKEAGCAIHFLVPVAMGGYYYYILVQNFGHLMKLLPLLNSFVQLERRNHTLLDVLTQEKEEKEERRKR